MFDGQLVLVIRRPFSKKEPLVDPTRVGVSSVILSDGETTNRREFYEHSPNFLFRGVA